MFLTNSLMNDILNATNHYNPYLDRNKKNVSYYFKSTDTAQTISLVVPGFQKSDIIINTSPSTCGCNALNISSNIDEQRLNDNHLLFDFNTTFRVSKEYDTDGIKANMQDGILTITLPKKEVVDVNRTIQID